MDCIFNDHGEALSLFNELRLEGKLCDVVLKVDDVEFNAHKIIMCRCSLYFRALFTNGWTASEKQVVDIHGLSPNMMRIIIEYAYTCSVPVTEENVEELLVTANQFCVIGIIGACCDFMEQQLSPEKCFSIWKFTDFCPDLRRKAYKFILYNFEEIGRASEELLELSLQQLVEIIEKDELNVKQESTVFEAVLRWIDHVPEERRCHISVLLSKVRLGLMSVDYFLNNVRNNTLVNDSWECRPIITKAMSAIYALITKRLSNSDFHNPLTRPRLPSAVLLAIGGWSRGGPTNVLEAYDSRADQWLNVTNDEESPRAYHGAAFLNGSVYCIGGFDSVDYFNSVRKFDLVTRTWQQVGPMYSRRCYVSVAVLNGCIYAMGGFNGRMRLNSVERYEPGTNQWTVVAPMNEARSDASAIPLHGKVYICGGFNGNDCLSTAECYNPGTNQWTLITGMLSRRSGLGVIAYREHIYAVGGFDDTNRLQSVEAYNPLLDTWRGRPPMLRRRSNFGIGVVDDRLFVVGGFNGIIPTQNVESYDENTGEWCEACNMEIFRSALSCCVVQELPIVAEYAAPHEALPLQ